MLHIKRHHGIVKVICRCSEGGPASARLPPLEAEYLPVLNGDYYVGAPLPDVAGLGSTSSAWETEDDTRHKKELAEGSTEVAGEYNAKVAALKAKNLAARAAQARH